MLNFFKTFPAFVRGSTREVFRGPLAYWVWMVVLAVLIISGALAYSEQWQSGLRLTHLRDQVSWGFYIGNFTFLVGVAAAAIMLVIPAYVYNWGPIREVVVVGELLAIAAIVMCLLFVTVDLGRPDRSLHLMVALNFPVSLLAWDVVVLNGYFVLNLAIVTHIVYRAYQHRSYDKRFVVPAILFSIPMAISIHTVTAFLYSGLPARPFWNNPILAPRFLASAFCSGPAVLLIALQIVRKVAHLPWKDEAFHKVAELMAYAMFINLFFFGAEIFVEFYSDTAHLVHSQYAFLGIDGETGVREFLWFAAFCNFSAFLLFLIPQTRRNFATMNLGCALIFMGVYIEKGMGTVVPGLTPDVLGEIYEYVPSLLEWRVGIGVYAVGFLMFTVMVKIATSITLGRLEYQKPKPTAAE